jgi:hypothetical protein
MEYELMHKLGHDIRLRKSSASAYNARLKLKKEQEYQSNGILVSDLIQKLQKLPKGSRIVNHNYDNEMGSDYIIEVELSHDITINGIEYWRV